MWTCKGCSESLEEAFDICWRCQTHRDGTPPTPEPTEEDLAPRPAYYCLRCQTGLRCLGERQFEQGRNGGWLKDLFFGREAVIVYACPGCGHVELFLSQGAG